MQVRRRNHVRRRDPKLRRRSNRNRDCKLRHAPRRARTPDLAANSLTLLPTDMWKQLVVTMQSY